MCGSFNGFLFLCYFDFRMEIATQKVNEEPQQYGTVCMVWALDNISFLLYLV